VGPGGLEPGPATENANKSIGYETAPDRQSLLIQPAQPFQSPGDSGSPNARRLVISCERMYK
jgi:hypothetical protein